MKKLTKRVQAGGLWFDVPMFTSHIVVNGDGDVWAINIVAASNLNRDGNDWRFPITEGGEYTHIGHIDLEGADWRECCFYVGDQRFGEEVECQEWMARGVEKSIELISDHSWGEGVSDGIIAATNAMGIVADKIRAGEIE